MWIIHFHAVNAKGILITEAWGYESEEAAMNAVMNDNVFIDETECKTVLPDLVKANCMAKVFEAPPHY